MPRTIKPRAGWRAAHQVPGVKLSRLQVESLCEAAGLNPQGRGTALAPSTECVSVFPRLSGCTRASVRTTRPHRDRPTSALRSKLFKTTSTA